MNELKVFDFEGNHVRTVIMDSEAWFIARDVCRILGLDDTSNAVARLDDDDHISLGCDDPILNRVEGITKSNLKKPVPIINEPGLYSLIIRSDKPEAKRFRRWVTHDVLPSIRKTGMYATDELINNPDLFIEVLQKLKREREKNKVLNETVGVQQQRIAEMQPKSSYYDVILNTKDAISITKIAKDYGKSGIWLNAYLHEKGIQFKQGDIWLLYAKYAEQGYTCTKTHTHLGSEGEMHSSVHTYWTQKGRLFLYDLLKNDGVLPLVEKETLVIPA